MTTYKMIFFFLIVLGKNAITSIPSEVGMLGSLKELGLCELLSTWGMLFCCVVSWLSMLSSFYLQNNFSHYLLQLQIQSLPFQVRLEC